ncbi:hypothetical protein ACHQM5_007128 [Ranunculus cassubicifolius]
MDDESATHQTFYLKVDQHHKATEFQLFSTAPPHMRAFYLAWLSLFSCFFSAFAIPPLLPIIRDDLNLTDTDIGNAGIASFIGSIFSRLAMGPICDLIGPRRSSATLSLVTAPIVFAASLASSPTSFVLLRFLIGFSLANFVSNQFWMSCMFSSNVVGLANGFAAGWAAVGSGVTQLVMPLIYSFIDSLGVASFTAWRVAFIVPATFQVVTAVMVLAYGQDLPDGNYRKPIQVEGKNFFEVLLHGLKNYRGWILGLTYGFCFGVELTINNIIAEYFYDRFNLPVEIAGAIAASFSMGNFISRPLGGILSDIMANKYGMRGRLWILWIVQTLAGSLCFVLGRTEFFYGSILVMCGVALCIQAASGLTFGVVPFVGGAVGAVTIQYLLFSGTKFSKETGISLMGIMMLVCTLPVTMIYFPQWGGMFCGSSIRGQDN